MEINRLKIFTIFIIFININQVYVFSQDCPPGINWVGATQSEASFSFGLLGGKGTVNYQKISLGNGDYAVKMDWNSMSNSTDFLSNSTMKKFLERQAVENCITGPDFEYTCHVKVYYTTTCYKKIRYLLKVTQVNSWDCCTDGVPPSLSLYNGQYVWPVYKTIECGQKCCMRDYTCKRVYDTIKERWVTDVSAPVAVDITTCGPPTISNCHIEGVPDEEPCESDCNSW